MKENRKIYLGLVTMLILAAIIIPSLMINKKEDGSRTYYFLGTVNEISIFHERKNIINKSLNEANNILSDVHNKMSLQVKNSEINEINKNAGLNPVKVSDTTLEVLKKSIYYSNISKGSLDASIGAISTMWNIGTENANVPEKDKINSKLHLVDYNKIKLDERKKTVYLTEEGMKIDLGAIAKGYCADLIANKLRNNGVKSAIINLGGNIYVIGQKEDRHFKIGIQDPNRKDKEAIGYVDVTDMSIVTSGVYERFIEKDGKFYHHILNPKTGYPFNNQLNSVTIISKKSIDGDALSTSTFGLGLEDGIKLIESLKDVDAIFVTNDKKIYLTSGIADNFKLIKNSYQIIK